MSALAELTARLANHVPRAASDPTRPRAAVAIVLAPGPDSVLLIQRAKREGDHWSGHLAFPGGRWSPGDPDLAATARRETWEEVGIDLTAPPLATLDDLAPRSPLLPPLVVRPFVHLLPAQLPCALNQEVAGAWWVPLDTLRRPGAHGPVEFSRSGTLLRTVGYQLEFGVLWGMTERILTPLLNLLP